MATNPKTPPTAPTTASAVLSAPAVVITCDGDCDTPGEPPVVVLVASDVLSAVVLVVSDSTVLLDEVTRSMLARAVMSSVDVKPTSSAEVSLDGTLSRVLDVCSVSVKKISVLSVSVAENLRDAEEAEPLVAVEKISYVTSLAPHSK
jgi:hypothetical protein